MAIAAGGVSLALLRELVGHALFGQFALIGDPAHFEHLLRGPTLAEQRARVLISSGQGQTD